MQIRFEVDDVVMTICSVADGFYWTAKKNGKSRSGTSETLEEAKRAVTEVNEDDIRENDAYIKMFVLEMCEVTEKPTTARSVIYDRYRTWCKERKITSLKINQFGKELEKHAIKKKTALSNLWCLKMRHESCYVVGS